VVAEDVVDVLALGVVVDVVEVLTLGVVVEVVELLTVEDVEGMVVVGPETDRK